MEVIKPTTFVNSDDVANFKIPKDKKPANLNREEQLIKDVKIKEKNMSTEFEEHLSSATDNDIVFEEEIIKPTASVNSNDVGKLEISKEIKKSDELANLLINMIEVKLTREEQIKEMEEKRQNEKYIQAISKCEGCALSFTHPMILEKHMLKHKKVISIYCRIKYI